MIFAKDDINHLPMEQASRGGPSALGLISLAGTADFQLPSQDQVTIPTWNVPTRDGRGNYLLLWKVSDGLSAVSASATYENANDPWRNLQYVERFSPDRWNENATGRWSRFPSTADPSEIYTWNRVPATRSSWYNPRAGGGHVGLLYFHNIEPANPFILPGTFGENARFLDWLVFAEVIGTPIYPSRTIASQFEAQLKKTTTTTSGLMTAALRSDTRVKRGRLNFANDPDTSIPATLEAAHEEQSVIMFPSGLDTFPEDNPTMVKPGNAFPAVLFGYTGARGYSGDLQDGRAWSGSISFNQTRR